MSENPRTQCDCGSEATVCLFSARDYVSQDPFQVYRCSACGLAFTSPVPEAANWERYYPLTYYGEVEGRRFPAFVESLQNKLYAARARRVEKLAGGRAGRVLDIGCGRGFLLQAFHRRGWEVMGVEATESAAAYARQRLKLPVHVGEVRDMTLLETSFDAVVMWHVLEHLARPSQILREVYRVLRPGGVFLVAVPNFGSLEAQYTRDKWFHLDVPRHLSHFTWETLAAKLKKAGFRIERTRLHSLEYDWFSATQSLLSRAGLKHNFLYDFLRQRQARTGNEIQLLGHILMLPVAASVGLAMSLLGGATLTIHARRL